MRRFDLPTTAASMSDRRFSFPLAIKFSPSSEAGQFTAYGSTFNGAPDAYGDVIAPGAFAKSIAAHRASGTAPALLWSHDQSLPIGVMTQLFEDSKGLRVNGQLALDVEKGRDAYALMKLGALSLSIGYQVVDSVSLGRRGRQLNEIKLFEISAVAIPANSSAKIISVKVATDQNNPRVIEKILRDAGVTRLHAKRILALGKAAFRQRDAVIAENNITEKLIAASRAIQNSI